MTKSVQYVVALFSLLHVGSCTTSDYSEVTTQIHNVKLSRRGAKVQAFNPDIHDVNDFRWNANMTAVCQSMSCPCDFYFKLLDGCSNVLKHSNLHDEDDVTVVFSGTYGHDCLYYNGTCRIDSPPQTSITERTWFLPCARMMKTDTAYLYDYNSSTGRWGHQLLSSKILREGFPQTVLTEPHLSQSTGGYHENMTFWYKDLPVPDDESKTGKMHNSFHVLLQTSFLTNQNLDRDPNPPVWLQVTWGRGLHNCGSCWGGVGCLGNRTTVFMIISILVSFTAVLVSTVWHCTAVAAAKQGASPPPTAVN